MSTNEALNTVQIFRPPWQLKELVEETALCIVTAGFHAHKVTTHFGQLSTSLKTLKNITFLLGALHLKSR